MSLISNSLPFLLLCLLLITSFSLSYAQPGFWFYSCGTSSNYTSNSPFATNLNTLLNTITFDTQLTHGGNHSYSLIAGTKYGQDRVTVTALCRGDLASSDCHSCFSDAAREIQEICPNEKEAKGWYSDCMLRYSDQPILGIMQSSPKFPVANSNNASDPEAFNRELMKLLPSLRAEAAVGSSLKWATGSRRVSSSQTVYAVFQCSPDLDALNCTKCLNDVIDYIPTCCYGKIGGAIHTPSCDFRFDIYQFYRTSDDPVSPTAHKGKSKPKRKLLLVLSLCIGIPTIGAIFVATGIWIHREKKKALLMQTANKEIEDIIAEESLQYDLATVKAATRNFSLDNKLGQGGFGEVYKGKLASGQQIAVKRLSKNSGQGIVEFKTEVVLVAKLQHKNLVKLLGFCLALKEKILVYEFLPNSSLDRFLFDPTKSVLLDWDIRFKIILGVARGLLYLHEDSRVKVIHRDLKASNILLDEAMNPKISDFGLARLFGVDETQATTKRIVGTYGYMAPEYAITGHYSVKSDVFSFGVIILEIVSGQKNRYFARSQMEEALLHRAWRLWIEENFLDLVDPTLQKKYPLEEVTKSIHIALLSLQEDPTERPKMTSIVAALNGDSSIRLPEPKAPQYFGNPRAIARTSSNGTMSPQPFREMDESNSYSGSENITNLYPR